MKLGRKSIKKADPIKAHSYTSNQSDVLQINAATSCERQCDLTITLASKFKDGDVFIKTKLLTHKVLDHARRFGGRARKDDGVLVFGVEGLAGTILGEKLQEAIGKHPEVAISCSPAEVFPCTNTHRYSLLTQRSSR